jgi:hypothetical protein
MSAENSVMVYIQHAYVVPRSGEVLEMRQRGSPKEDPGLPQTARRL